MTNDDNKPANVDAITAPVRPPLAAKRFGWIRTLSAYVGRHVDVWRSAWAEEKRQEPVAVPHGRELEFLPAVLELQESPPAPLGRAIAATIIGLFTVAIVWASIGEIDIVAVAQGKIIPSDHSKVIQPLESGVITAIHVRDGQAVKQGDLLIELDATTSGADEDRLSNEHVAAAIESARLRAVIAGRSSFDPPAGADPVSVGLQQQLLQDQLAEYRARTQSAKLMIAQRDAAVKGTQANIERLEATVPMLTQRAEAMRQLLDKQYVSQTQYLEIEENRVNKTQELAMERHKLVQNDAALTEARRNHQALVAEFMKARRGELAAVETRVASLSQEVVKAETKSSQQRLTAPISGIVQQLAVHTVGGVVTPAQQLMVVAPKEGQLEVEAWIDNKDVGFVNPGQDAEIKVEAFPFTRYGVIDGKLITLSTDAVPIEKVGLVYSTRVSMSKTTMQLENKQVNLSPGMNVTVEIKTGQRKLIEFFLDPLLRGVKETARER